MNVRIEESWKQVLQPEFDKPYFELLTQYVRQQYKTCRCFPPAGLIFNAFDSCPFDKVRVVIIGQDPYHEEGQAMGLSFSVPEGTQIGYAKYWLRSAGGSNEQNVSIINCYGQISENQGRIYNCSVRPMMVIEKPAE